MSSRDCNDCSNLLRRDGTSQKQRLFEEQQTDYVLIDERSVLDLMQFTLKYAEKIQFWDVFNRRSGDWVAMMENKQAAIYTNIANVDINQLQLDFDAIYSVEIDDVEDTTSMVIDMIKSTVDVAKILDGWLAELDGNLDLSVELQNSIQRQAAPLIRALIKFDKGAYETYLPFGFPVNIDELASFGVVNYLELSDYWLIDVIGTSSDISSFSEVDDIKRQCKVFFMSMLGVVEKMQLEAEKKFEEHLYAYAKHEPHFALFLAFIQLYKHAQTHINKLTGDHLEFYYREVLQLEEKASRPDSVHVIFEPAKNVDQKKVDAGTSLIAGKDENGAKILFETDEEIVINKASVAKVQTLFLDRDVDLKYIQTIYAASHANSLDGKGEALAEDGVWEPFGKTQVADGTMIQQTTMEPARVGFAFASPELNLKDGFRIVSLTITPTSASFDAVFGSNGTFEEYAEINLGASNFSSAQLLELYGEKLSEWLDLRLTGEKEWVTPDNSINSGLLGVTVNSNTIIIDFSLSREKGAIISHSAEIHGANYDTEWPVLEILCKQEPKLNSDTLVPSAYEFLKDLTFERVKIECQVTGVSNLVLGNDTGELDAAKPFYPFTANPQVGSNFYIGSQEVFSKRLTYLNIDLDWKGVPDAKLTDYYRHYQQTERWCDSFQCFVDGPKVIVQDNAHFTAHLKFLDDFGWKQLSMQNTKVPMHQSSGLALKQDRDTMIADAPLPLMFFLISWFTNYVMPSNWQSNNAANALPEDAAMLQYWDVMDPVKDIQRDQLTDNYVNLFRHNISNDEINGELNDARLPNTIEIHDTSSDIGGPYQNYFGLLANTTGGYARSPYLPEVESYSEGVKRGFIKLELVNDFFHAAYGKVLTERLNRTSVSGTAVDAPNAPYTPELHKVTLNYKSSYEWNCAEIEWDDRVEQFYHITPFGEMEVFPSTSEKELSEESADVYYSNRLVPNLFKKALEILPTGRPESKIDPDTGRLVLINLEETSEGKLFIGIENLVVPQSLSLLFQFKEGTEDNDLEVPAVEWSYLSKNQWVAFEVSEIVSDSTNGLVNSGIIKFSVPSSATTKNYLAKDELTWIRADVAGNTEAFSDLISIHAQAVKATYAETESNDPNRLSTEIEAGVITKLVDKDFEIKSLSQPYASFDGRVKEQSTHFFTRVAERLRHKQRGITIRDYEHLVLEEFPEIYKVKCINHTSKFSEYSPGSVSVVVIPYFKNQNERNPFELKVSKAKLSKIKRFLVKLNSPFVNLDVRNPKYETIRVDFNVEFHIGYDRTYYKEQLNEEIKSFLSPWAYGKEEDIIFGGKINRSLILNFIEEREYVDYVTDFVMWHKENENKAEVDVFIAEGTTASSVLVTATNHQIGEV